MGLSDKANVCGYRGAELHKQYSTEQPGQYHPADNHHMLHTERVEELQTYGAISS